MSLVETIAKLDSILRPKLNSLSPALAVRTYSNSRSAFLDRFFREKPNQIRALKPIKLWDIDFNCNLFNSAGMFKNGAGYNLVARQGAGAFLAGTSTYYSRQGNKKLGAKAPLSPLPHSGAALNWMGLPNAGHETIAAELSRIDKIKGCPVGISISSDPGLEESEAINNLLYGLSLFERANVDFIEINESCPNVEHSHCELDSNGLDKSLVNRLEIISDKFIKQLQRNLPVIVKFSNDTDPNQLESLVNLLISLNYSGINLGNTSTKYDYYKAKISKNEIKNYDYFISNFGGGISGRPLKETSLILARKTQILIKKASPTKEFIVTRTGGIETASDLIESSGAGIALNQWYTGYFESFASYGHRLYESMYE